MVRTKLDNGCSHTPVHQRPPHPAEGQFTPEASQTQAPRYFRDRAGAPRRSPLDSTRSGEAGGRGGVPPPPGLDAARAMALDGLARAFEEAEAGRDWFAMTAALRRVEDAVRAVWYASRVRDDARR